MKRTTHSATRLAQRAIRPTDIDLTIQFGVRIRQDHSEVYYLSRRILRELSLDPQEKERLEGIAIVVGDDTIITGFKNRRGLKRGLRRRGYSRIRRGGWSRRRP